MEPTRGRERTSSSTSTIMGTIASKESCPLEREFRPIRRPPGQSVQYRHHAQHHHFRSPATGHPCSQCPGSFPRNQTPVCLARSSSRSEWCTRLGLPERRRKLGGVRARATAFVPRSRTSRRTLWRQTLDDPARCAHLLLRLRILRCRKSHITIFHQRTCLSGLSDLCPIAPAA